MINLIIGQNALGKTAYLKQLISRLDFNKIITNIEKDPGLDITPYNEDRINILKDIAECGEVMTSLSLINIADDMVVYSIDFLTLITLLCRDRDILILDEPDMMLNITERSLLVNFIAYAERTYKLIVIVTHDSLTFSLPNYTLYTVVEDSKNKFELEKVEVEKQYEIID